MERDARRHQERSGTSAPASERAAGQPRRFPVVGAPQAPASSPAVPLHVGLDIGSTTTKTLVLDPRDNAVLFWNYRRHNARQADSVTDALRTLAERFGDAPLKVAVCGSGAQAVAEALGAPYIQEVVANAVAVRVLHPSARCAIELGGQDAKMVFFRRDAATGRLDVADMRMNGSCAGGTGAFIDEIAKLLKVPVEEFDALASQGATLHDISGRCGVYAKTDIQPLLNQGVPKADIALSSLHAVAKQTIGGLAQGLDIEAPVVFEGGVLTYIPTLVRVFAERLGLGPDEVIVPEHPQTIVAHGAALALGELFADAPSVGSAADAARTLEEGLRRIGAARSADGDSRQARPFFADDAERAAFEERHARAPEPCGPQPFADAGRTSVRVYLGIDSGSTTTKFAVLGEDRALLDAFYASNEGEPLEVARKALEDLRDRWRAAGVELDVAGVGTTGYGEDLFAHALHADHHTVETVAHARAATEYVPDASFILDIGGQDMKAVWLDRGVLTDIVVNEACSSGCGSFLENFAGSLGIPVDGIARAAFSSPSPAELGSRCTVFMTSSIVSEQRLGKTPDDIMAGLCRSIIENVFTKVVRVANLDSLGERIVVQGGTFENDAVLRALEQYLGREVVRAPYPGLMGAIGIALLTQEQMEKGKAAGAEQSEDTNQAAGAEQPAAPSRSRFIGLDALHTLADVRRTAATCPHCENRCSLALMTFGDGTTWVTGNRCPRGASAAPAQSAQAAQPSQDEGADGQAEEPARPRKAPEPRRPKVPNLFDTRRALLFKRYPVEPLAPAHGQTLGLPRVLALWDTAPFWTTFLRALGFEVKLSHPSTRAMYEEGLPAVTSDTVCFPAKLVHGHVRDLVRMGVDRIFMPSVTTVPSENTEKTSESMCAVVKGYPIVVQNSDNPEKRWGVPFDNPLFHWYTDEDRDRQLAAYMQQAFDVAPELTRAALVQADAAQASFRDELERAGAEVLDQVERDGGWAVVLGARPYHNDALVNHDLPHLFCELDVPVLPPDAVPGVRDVDLSRSRLDIVNNYHARMLSSALIAASDPRLEYAQIVSFGCGHDAYLSDEIARLMRLTSDKAPLVLKVDESDARGPLRIRVRSFVETVARRREHEEPAAPRPLPDPYPQKYTKADRKEKVVLVPNTSHAFARLMSAAFSRQGIRAEALDIGRDEAIRLGKKYVHNDICFPAQMTVGEALAALESGRYDGMDVAIGTGKYIGDCRLTHYCALLRKALDDAGYAHVPIITNDDVDYHDLHPGFKISLASSVTIAMGLPMVDALEELLRKMRPYELEPGSADRAFNRALDAVMEGIEHHGVRGAVAGFRAAVDIMREVRYDRSNPRPTVLIVGEYLLNFHPGANHDVEAYLEANGLEVVEARMTDVIRKTYFYKDAQIKEYHVSKPLPERAWYDVANRLFEVAHDVCDRIARRHPLYGPATRLPELARESDPVLNRTFDAGEGILIPGEILHHAKHGCRNFLILQPFGCLPNHVVGRGLVKRLKELYPDAQILPLDYDPDVSLANVENRLQMLIMNARAHGGGPGGEDGTGAGGAQENGQDGAGQERGPRGGHRERRAPGDGGRGRDGREQGASQAPRNMAAAAAR